MTDQAPITPASNGNSVMRFLTRDDIFAVNDVIHENVDVPEWGGVVRVKGLSGTERDAFEQSTIDQRTRDIKMNMRNMRAKLVCLAVVDEQGNALFTRTDVEALGQKSAKALDRVYEVATRLSGLSKEDQAKLAGNSDQTLDDSFTSG